jgi:hypothetical protein
MLCYSLDRVFNLGEFLFAAKPLSVRIAHHSVGFFDLGEDLFTAKFLSECDAIHSTEVLT